MIASVFNSLILHHTYFTYSHTPLKIKGLQMLSYIMSQYIFIYPAAVSPSLVRAIQLFWRNPLPPQSGLGLDRVGSSPGASIWPKSGYSVFAITLTTVIGSYHENWTTDLILGLLLEGQRKKYFLLNEDRHLSHHVL